MKGKLSVRARLPAVAAAEAGMQDAAAVAAAEVAEVLEVAVAGLLATRELASMSSWHPQLCWACLA